MVDAWLAKEATTSRQTVISAPSPVRAPDPAVCSAPIAQRTPHPTIATGSTIVGSSSPSPVRFTRRSTVHSRNALSVAGCSTSGPASPESQVAKSALQ